MGEPVKGIELRIAKRPDGDWAVTDPIAGGNFSHPELFMALSPVIYRAVHGDGPELYRTTFEAIGEEIERLKDKISRERADWQVKVRRLRAEISHLKNQIYAKKINDIERREVSEMTRRLGDENPMPMIDPTTMLLNHRILQAKLRDMEARTRRYEIETDRILCAMPDEKPAAAAAQGEED